MDRLYAKLLATGTESCSIVMEINYQPPTETIPPNLEITATVSSEVDTGYEVSILSPEGITLLWEGAELFTLFPPLCILEQEFTYSTLIKDIQFNTIAFLQEILSEEKEMEVVISSQQAVITMMGYSANISEEQLFPTVLKGGSGLAEWLKKLESEKE